MAAGPSPADGWERDAAPHPVLRVQVRRVHALCFPGDPPADLPDAEWLDRAAVCHDAGDCVWLLLWRARGGGRRGELVAICAGAPYSTSLYGFALGVAPAWRKTGLGPRIMHGLQAAALARGTPAIAATVDASAAQLLAYYESFGGVVEATGGWGGGVGGEPGRGRPPNLRPPPPSLSGVTAPGSPPPPSVRVVKRFDAAELARVVAAADARIAAALRSRRRARLVAAAAVAAAVVVTVAWAARRAQGGRAAPL